MKELTFEVRFQELRTNGDDFKDVKGTNTEFQFMLNRNPECKFLSCSPSIPGCSPTSGKRR